MSSRAHNAGALRAEDEIRPEAEQQADSPARLQLAVAASIGALAAFDLFGWVFHFRDLTRVAAINPTTAIAFLLAAGALVLPPRSRAPVVRLLACTVAALGAAKLVQLTWGLPFGIDQTVFADQLDPASRAAPNQIAPNTALALVLIGVAMAVSGSRRRATQLACQALAMAALAIAVLAVISNVLDSTALHELNFYNAMGIWAALGLCGLAIAVIGINPGVGVMRIFEDRGPAGSLARTSLLIIPLVPVLVGLAGPWGQRAVHNGTVDGVAIQLFANIAITLSLVAIALTVLLRSDRARRERENAVTQSEGQYRHAEQVGHVGHWQVECPSGQVKWSDEFYVICGLPRTTPVSAATTLSLLHPDDAIVAREVVAQALRDGSGWETGHRIRRPDGEVRHIKSHGVCDRGADGELVAIFGVIVDVTELELSRREAEAATASKAAFLANMSHEIRTPMNGVMGFIELLLDSNLDAQQRLHLALIQDSAQALLKLLNDILDLSKIEAGQLEVNPEPSDVRGDIVKCVQLMTPVAERKGLVLSARLAQDFPAQVMVDSLRLRQILFNVLGNAVKFTNRGSVTVTLSNGLDAKLGKVMMIGVRDTGVGIDPEREAAIFDAFVQADASISRRFGGSGLGLSISRRLARLLEGTITLESEEGKGTLVTVTLPLTPARMEADVDALPVPSQGDVPDPAVSEPVRASILLVEDIDINQELVVAMLTRLGHKVEVAGNGREALECARRLKQMPDSWDLILMDVQMPVMDGLTATRAIRALGGRAAVIPIVALTANAFEREMHECREAGMNDHVAKPSGMAQLQRVVERWAGAASSPAVEPEPARLSLVERFEARRLTSGGRLTGLIAELDGAEPAVARSLLLEAANIAHVFAGTAGSFGQERLGEAAREVEEEIKSAACDSTIPTVNPAIQRFVAALDAAAPQPDTLAPPL